MDAEALRELLGKRGEDDVVIRGEDIPGSLRFVQVQYVCDEVDDCEPPAPVFVRDVSATSAGTVAASPVLHLAAIAWVKCRKEHNAWGISRDAACTCDRLINLHISDRR